MKSSFVIIALTAFTLSGVAANSAESASEQNTYKIRPGDRVSIIVYGHEKLGVRDAAVDASGALRLGGISESIQAAGLSVAEIRAIAESRYRKIGVEGPRVSVYGHATAGNRIKLVSSVPPIRLPDDPVRSDARQN
jgi:protein involved in polysaccharide export with SLBB domain